MSSNSSIAIPEDHKKFNAGEMRSGEQPVTFGVERITEVAADLVLKFRNETFASMERKRQWCYCDSVEMADGSASVERKQNFFTEANLVKADLLDKNQADIAFLRGVLYEVWQQGRACGMREENERRQDVASNMVEAFRIAATDSIGE